MKPILPGAAIGVLGGGQLGRMFAIAARQMGYRVHTLSPDSDTPAGLVSDVEVSAPYDDGDAVRAFARNVAAVTFEFENVPFETAMTLESLLPVRPSGAVLHVAQNRIREKAFLAQAGLPVAPHRVVRALAELRTALREIGCPAILKTAESGYDGKGQAAIHSASGAEAAWNAIGGRDSVLEAFVDFECELSVVAARGEDGAFVHYGLLENHHRNHILETTIAPARVPAQIATEAAEIARAVLERFGAIGVVCVEFFLTRGGKLLINELAPRPHNSGHFTLDACVTSQFEQQLRAVCGLPLGSTRQFQAAAMTNLLGDLWTQGEPDWAAVCGCREVKLHLYGKREARPGRKMGHLTALGADPDSALRAVKEAMRSLVPRENG